MSSKYCIDNHGYVHAPTVGQNCPGLKELR